jgi:hypothetical protein
LESLTVKDNSEDLSVDGIKLKWIRKVGCGLDSSGSVYGLVD